MSLPHSKIKIMVVAQLWYVLYWFCITKKDVCMNIDKKHCIASKVIGRMANGTAQNLSRSQNLSVEIAEILSDRIIKMELKEGERILEAKVSKELGVSQSSLREALRVMEQNGLVEVNPRRGTYVTFITENDIVMLYDILTELYTILAEKGMRSASPAAAEDVVKMLDMLEKSAIENNVDAYYTTMFSVALAALEIVGSSILTKVMLDLWPTKRRIEYITISARKNELAKSITHFKTVRESILESNAAGIIQAIRDFTQDEKTTALHIYKMHNEG